MTAVPKRLGPEGRRLWRDIADAYELRADERRLLEDACREVDLIEELEVARRTASLITEGHTGQPVLSPIIDGLRQHRTLLRSLLGALRLPDEPSSGRARSRSAQARDAAASRWSRGA